MPSKAKDLNAVKGEDSYAGNWGIVLVRINIMYLEIWLLNRDHEGIRQFKERNVMLR